MLYVLKRNYKNFVTKLILNTGYCFSMMIQTFPFGCLSLIRFGKSLNIKKKIIAVQLLDNVVLVSAVQQSESAIATHISPLFGFASHLGHHRALRSLCYYGRLSLVVYFMYSINSACMSIPLSPFIPPLPSPLGNCKFVLYIYDSISSFLLWINAVSQFH